MPKRFVEPIHQQVEIETRNGKIKVDSGIAPLVLALNELPEIFTCSSCECGDDGLATVAFEWERKYKRADILPLFDSLQRRILRKPNSYAMLIMYWAVPQEFPTCELQCDPDRIEDISESVLRLAQSRRRSSR